MRQVEPVHELGVEAWDGKTGDGIDQKPTKLRQLDSRGLSRLQCHLFEESERVALKNFRPVHPVMRRVVPLAGLACVTRANPGLAVEGLQVIKMREQGAGVLGGLSLGQFVGGKRRGHAGDLDIEICGRLARP